MNKTSKFTTKTAGATTHIQPSALRALISKHQTTPSELLHTDTYTLPHYNSRTHTDYPVWRIAARQSTAEKISLGGFQSHFHRSLARVFPRRWRALARTRVSLKFHLARRLVACNKEINQRPRASTSGWFEIPGELSEEGGGGWRIYRREWERERTHNAALSYQRRV